jgi:hypothetical protein
MKIGGYTKGDLYYDVDQDLGDTFNTVFLSADGAATKEPSFRAHARQTRVNLTTWTPTDVGQVKTFIEGDFFGDGGNELLSNSTALRLRHAFGQLSTDNWDFLVGQTWTNFMGLKTIPDTIDFHGPTGFPFVRQGQRPASPSYVRGRRAPPIRASRTSRCPSRSRTRSSPGTTMPSAWLARRRALGLDSPSIPYRTSPRPRNTTRTAIT